MMGILYTQHALLRMSKRHITRSQVEKTLRDPDWTDHAKQGRQMSIKKFGKKEVEVVYNKGQADYTIIIVRVWRR